jgi:hypothetical protein
MAMVKRYYSSSSRALAFASLAVGFGFAPHAAAQDLSPQAAAFAPVARQDLVPISIRSVAEPERSQDHDYRPTANVTSQSGSTAGPGLAVAIALVGVVAFARKREDLADERGEIRE